MKVDFHMIKIDRDKDCDIEKMHSTFSQYNNFNLHCVEGVDGHIGKSRVLGFSQGDCDLVSYVDPDDEIYLDKIEQCLYLFEDKTVDAVCMLEKINGVDPNKFLFQRLPDHCQEFNLRQSSFIHHGVIYRREALERFFHYLSRWPQWPEHALNIMMVHMGHKFLAFNEVVYNWIKGDSHKCQNIKPTLETLNLIRKARGFSNLEALPCE